MKTALVTGGSSGIGRSTAAALKNAGFAVYEFSLDVTDENAVQKAVGEILSEAGKLLRQQSGDFLVLLRAGQ